MAENRNGRMRERGGWADEPPYEDEMFLEPRRDEANLPPRDVLESDSAKYTAEFVKGVVKGLYTAGASAPEDGASEYRTERSYEPEPAYSEGPRVIKKVQRDYDEPIPQRRTESVPEKLKPAREASFNMKEEDVLAADGFLRAYEEKNRQDRPMFTKKTGRRTFSSLAAEDGAEFDSPRSKEPKKQGGAPPYVDSIDEPEEEYVFIKQDLQKGARSYGYSPEPEGEALFRRVSQPVNIEEREGFKSVPAYEEIPPNPDKIPIIINKRVESKPKKTADDYRNKSRDEREIPPRRLDSQPSGPTGASIIAVVFMIAAVVIIGLLVWKVNSLSKEAGQYDAEELASLREQNALLSQRSAELEIKYNDLLNDYEALQEENRLLREPPPEAIEEEPSDEPSESTQDVDGLEDGYYTVQRGDTLWKISERFLGSGERYTEIASLNNLNSAQSLYAGLKIKIPTQ